MVTPLDSMNYYNGLLVTKNIRICATVVQGAHRKLAAMQYRQAVGMPVAKDTLQRAKDAVEKAEKDLQDALYRANPKGASRQSPQGAQEARRAMRGIVSLIALTDNDK